MTAGKSLPPCGTALRTAPSPPEVILPPGCDGGGTQYVIAASVNCEKGTYLKLSICSNPSASTEIRCVLYLTVTKGSDE